jgi:hypothetical protein
MTRGFQSLNSSLSRRGVEFWAEFLRSTTFRVERGSFIKQVIQNYFKDESVAGLALELWRYLRWRF